MRRVVTKERAAALSGPRILIRDSNMNLLGKTFVADLDDKMESARLVRPVLPYGELLLYHQLWRALLRGAYPSTSPPRPTSPAHRTARSALPVELVRLIVRAASFIVPDRDQTHRAERSVFVHVVILDEEPVVSRVWFWTKPLAVSKIAAIQLLTVSRDQGWVSPPTTVCHSWFEWGVFNGGVPTEDAPGTGRDGTITGNEAAWGTSRTTQTDGEGTAAKSKATWRRTHGNPVAQGQYRQHAGARVGMDDEMWEGVTAGAIIAVRACAQQEMWENDARYGEILVWKWFEPVV
ncbi:hypothetical protein FB451DRAFT_1266848 [Mycena latifolia]|nr:hypothetical protein FB451DRAFT_1266848 [Mycena latifolia]